MAASGPARLSRALAAGYLAIALCCLVVIGATLVLRRPFPPAQGPPAGALTVLGVVLLAGVVVAVVERVRERFADEPAGSGGPAGVVVLVLIGLGLLAGFSGLGGAGMPGAARDGCPYPLRERGTVFTCVSAAEYRERGASVQRSTAGVVLAVSAAAAGAFLGIARRRDDRPGPD